MSGSGGYGGYEPPMGPTFDCASPNLQTTLSSIDLDVLSQVNIGDILQIDISPERSLVLLDNDGQTLGSIVHVCTKDIISCIEQGNQYSGKIISKIHSACKIKIIKR